MNARSDLTSMTGGVSVPDNRLTTAGPIRRRAAGALLLAALTVGLFVYLLQLSWTYTLHSDLAAHLLAAYDMLHGNWTLHGWAMFEDPYWLLDLPLYAGGMAVAGLTPTLLHEIPTLLYVLLIVLVGLAVATFRGGTPGYGWLAAAVALIPLVFPSSLLGSLVLTGPYHTSTIAAVLASLLVLEAACGSVAERAARKMWLRGTAFLLLTSATIGDPYAVGIGLLPIVIVSLRNLAGSRTGHSLENALSPMLVAIVAWLAARTVLWFVVSHGGFVLHPFEYPVAFAHASVRLWRMLLWTLSLVGANAFSVRTDVTAVPSAIRLLGSLGFLCTLLWPMWVWLRGGLGDWLSAVLAVASVILLTSYIALGLDAGRYLVPMVVFASVTAGRWLGSRLGSLAVRKEWVGLALCLFVIFYSVAPNLRLTRGPAAFPEASISSWLLRHNLTRGYGDYLDAYPITVATKGVVRILPVEFDGRQLVPNLLMGREDWYSTNSSAQFLLYNLLNFDENAGWLKYLYQDLGRPDRAYRLGAVGCVAGCAETGALLGQPDRVYRIIPYVVLVWNQGIALRVSAHVDHRFRFLPTIHFGP